MTATARRLRAYRPRRYVTRALAGLDASVHVAIVILTLVTAALLRIPHLDQVPNGFFLDEASRGYDAYAILRTGADQYGVFRPIFAEGLDDYTPTLYTYLVVPFVAILGPTETAVRLPAALVGTATVGLTFLAARAFFGRRVGMAAAVMLAISPWHILPSRTGTEWILLPAFALLGLWLLRLGLERPRCLLWGGLVLGLGLYTYSFARLLIPLLVFGFVVLWWRELRREPPLLVALGLTLALLAIPLVTFSASVAGQARLAAVVPFGRLSGSELVAYVAANYLSYFDPSFLVWGSERTDHHRLAGFGPLLWFMVPLVAMGLYRAARRRSRSHLFWLWWMLAAPAASALHRESPSSALLLGAIPSWHVLAALSVQVMRRETGRRHVAVLASTSVILAAATATAMLMAKALYFDYPLYAARDWSYGAREVIQFLEARRSAYDTVLVSDRLETPHILVLFHARVDPASYQQTPIHVRQPNLRSRGEIGQYRFGRIEDLLAARGTHLAWVGAAERVDSLAGSRPVFSIDYPDGTPAHRVYEARRP